MDTSDNCQDLEDAIIRALMIDASGHKIPWARNIFYLMLSVKDWRMERRWSHS